MTPSRRLTQPVIAAITGYALGGGFELALAADFRFIAENAMVGLPEITLGVIPGAGGTQRLARLIGPTKAKELIFTGRPVSADEAVALGLASKAVPADQVFGEAMAMATRLAAGPTVALAAAKRAIDDGLDGPLAAGLELEAEKFAELFGTEDARTGMTSFVEQGPGKADVRRSLTGRRAPWPTSSRVDDVRYLTSPSRIRTPWRAAAALAADRGDTAGGPDQAAQSSWATAPRRSPRPSGCAGGRSANSGPPRPAGCSPTRRCSRRRLRPVAAHRAAPVGRYRGARPDLLDRRRPRRAAGFG